MPPDYVPSGAENILDHGAISNPTDPADGSYSINRQALIDAMSAAGRGGSIYVPTGTYYFGEDDSNSWIAVGGHTPHGISIYGDGADNSELAMTEHVPDTNVASMFDYSKDGYTSTNHTVTIREIRLNGNSPNLPNLASNDLGSRVINVRNNPELDFQLTRVHFYQSYNSHFRNKNGSVTADYCTFEHSGIKLTNDQPSSVEHHVVPSPQSSNNDQAIFNNCKFITASGNAFDPGGDGYVEANNCYVEGVGTGLLKNQHNHTVFNNVYAKPHTQNLEDILPDAETTAGFAAFDGRMGAYSQGGDGSDIVEMYDVRIEDTTIRALYVNDNGWTVKGDNISIERIGHKYDENGGALRERNDAVFDWDVTNMSIHDITTSMDIFEMTGGGGSGTIDTLSYDSGQSLGTLGGVTVTNLDEGGASIQPDVPTEDETGYDATTTTTGTLYSTDFTDVTLTDFSPQWDSTSSDWNIVNETSFHGNTKLQLDDSGSNRHALSWDTVGTETDVEVLALGRVEENNDVFEQWARTYVRGSGSAGNETAYFSTHETPDFRLDRYLDGDFNNISSHGDHKTGEWYWTRLRVNGDSIQQKNWHRKSVEPDSWDINITNTSIGSSGWVGLGAFSGDVSEWDYLAVGTEGKSPSLPGQIFSTTFIDSDLDNFTNRWDGAKTDFYTVIDQTKFGNEALELNSSSQSRRALSWDVVSDEEDVEMLSLVRVVSDNDAYTSWCRLYARGNTSSEDSYFTSLRHETDRGFTVDKYHNGVRVELGSFGNYTDGDWYWSRLKVSGTSVKGKWWPRDESEPSLWDIEVSDSDVSSGWVGIGGYSGDRQQWDYLAVGTKGESPQVPAIVTPLRTISRASSPTPTVTSVEVDISCSTLEPTNLGVDSVTLNGSLDSLAGFDTGRVYFQYRKTEEGAPVQETTHQEVQSTTEFSEDISGLDTSTQYEYRAVAFGVE